MKKSHDAVANWGTGQSTNADSASYQAFPSQDAISVGIINNSGTSIHVRKVDSGDDPIVLLADMGWSFALVSDLSEIEWKRTDGASTSTSISYYWNL